MLRSTYKPSPGALPPLPPGWTEHKAPTGHTYYYNAATKESTYKRPGVTPTPTPPAAAVSPFGPPSASPVPGAHPLAAAPTNPSMSYLQHQTVPSINLSDPRVANAFMAQYAQQNQPHSGGRGGFGAGGRGGNQQQQQQQQQRPRPQPTDKPKAKIAILGCEPWFLVYTKYGRRFAYNPVKKASYWRIPEKILPAVIELDKERIRRKAAGEPPLEEDAKYQSHEKEEEEEKVEAKEAGGSGQQGQEETTHDYDSSEYEEVEVTDDEGADHDDDPEHPSKRRRTTEEPGNQGPIEFTEDDFAAQLAMMEGEGEGDGMDVDEMDQEYDFAAQAQEENVDDEPLSDTDARLLFRDLLSDLRINPYSPFQKLIDEGDKTGVFSDPRYTVLTSMRARREVYDEWSREAILALKEARANKEEKKDPRIPYLAFLQEHATPKLYWAEFKRKHRKEDVMKDSMSAHHHRSFNDKEREKLYREHINRLKLPQSQLKSELKKLLESVPLRQLNNRSSIASLPSQILADIRYISLDVKTRDEFIEGYIQGLAPPPEAGKDAGEEEEDEMLRKAREERRKREKALEERERRVEEEKRRQEKRLALERARLREEERELQRAMVVDKKGLQSQLAVEGKTEVPAPKEHVLMVQGEKAE
ncbi:FF domain-containing protein-containing protein [Copromyces sp. CBS 386.78]|nr:FF domain-containing protein-containing protein [Copromyces sp. CBS 386.78]